MKKREGLEFLTAKEPPVPMSEMLLLDWYAGMALMGCEYQDAERAAAYSMERARAMLNERSKYEL